MIKSLLIANRGEIACRIIRTARRMGVRTIAVHSDADAGAMHVRLADHAEPIGAAAAAESYLVGARIIDVAKTSGADAIHPGYGFLSENADFAEAVIDAGLVWVGPPPAAIRAMGLKDAAKALMKKAGVPVTPGYQGDDQSLKHLKAEADKIGYPVLIKAVAGGGGKGMRKVDKASDFKDALVSCQREARASFGNDVVLIEKWIHNPRHIEVQVFGDDHGHVVHLFERDCSLQRRHQKVIEEAPAPGMDEATRQAICEAAVRAAKAVNYVGAGTIEFIADGSDRLHADRIWFMEMNTRLQVEHPVTEMITGQDLVDWQLRVAAGEPLPCSQDELAINGWAMEARVYAEDPATGFLPSIGPLDHFQLGMTEGGRIDTGVEQGGAISPFYDPMIAKVIAHGSDREQALTRLGQMLCRSSIWPLKTNLAFLVNTLENEDFVAGIAETGLIERNVDQLVKLPAPCTTALRQAARTLTLHGSHPGFRLNAPACLSGKYLLNGDPVDVPVSDGVMQPDTFALVHTRGQTWQLSPWRNDGSIAGGAGSGDLLSPMPGKVLAVEVERGQHVAKGQKLITLEAMKMEHTLTAPFDGIVAELNATTGGQVQVDALLVRIEQEAD